MAYRKRLPSASSPTSRSPTRASFTPPSDVAVGAVPLFPPSSPFPCPRRSQAVSPPDTHSRRKRSSLVFDDDANVLAGQAFVAGPTLLDLPFELLLEIASLLYLPQTAFVSAHERNVDLTNLSLAFGGIVHEAVRATLFASVLLREQREVRWLLRRKNLSALVRHLTIASRPLVVHLPLLMQQMPDLVSLVLSCKLSLASLSAHLCPALATPSPGALASLRRLDLTLAQAFTKDVVEEITDALIKGSGAVVVDMDEGGESGVERRRCAPVLETLVLRVLRMDHGFISDHVQWRQDELDLVLPLLVDRLPALQTLTLPVLVGHPQPVVATHNDFGSPDIATEPSTWTRIHSSSGTVPSTSHLGAWALIPSSPSSSFALRSP